MKVLVLGPARHSHVSLKALCVDIVLMTRKVNYAFNSFIAKEDLNFPYVSVHLMGKEAESDAYSDLAIFLNKEHKFDAVCCFHDEYQDIAVDVAKALNLPTLYNSELLKTVANKDRTRAIVCEALGEPAEFKLAGSAEEVADIVATLGYPLVLKPSSSTGSIGVSIIKSDEDIARSLARFKEVEASFPAIVERYYEGPEYSVEAFSEDGQHKVIAITKKFVDPVSRVEIGHLTPAPLSDEDRSQIEKYVSSVLSALKLNDGPSHTEVILTSEGPKLLETHTRIGGDRIWDLVTYSTGIDMPLLSARQSIGEKVFSADQEIKHTKSLYSAIWYLLPTADEVGTLETVTGIKEACNVDSVVEVKVLLDKGSKVDKVTNSFERAAKSIAVADSAEVALKAAQNAIEKLAISLAEE